MVIVFVLAVGIAIAAVPRTDLVRAMDHAKRYIDGLLDGIGPVAERASEAAEQMLQEASDRIGDGFPEVQRPQLSGRVRVVDGDSLELGQARVRLHGIDAPEGRQSCTSDGRRWPCGEQATRALAQRIGSRSVACEERDRDQYGRIVAVCREGGQDINAWMVSQGWALAYRRYSRDYVAEESTARAAKRGLWRGDFVAPWDWRRGQRLGSQSGASRKSSGSGCRIKGNIGRDGSRIYHVPGGQFYERTRIHAAKGERLFCTEAEARAAGWRRAKQ